jgi:P-type E1-E2 ATPase
VLEADLTFLAVFALKDDLRSSVMPSVKFANRANIVVRMVSGDNMETAKAVAIKAGIIANSSEAD